MRLSEMNHVVQMDILRDGEFNSLGLLSHETNKMLVALYDTKYYRKLKSNFSVSCVITTSEYAGRIPESLCVAVCDDPQAAFYGIHAYLVNETNFYWASFDSEVSPEAIISDRAYIAPKNVRIGRGAIIEPNVTILERSIIGEDVVVRAGAVIGGEGFEPKFVKGKHIIIPHAGGVLLGDRVEIQANCHIARCVFGGFTEVGEDTKLDALVHIAHNVRVGQRCEIAACAMFAGSCVIGDDVFIGPNASISSEVHIGSGAFITLGAVVTRDVPKGERVSGNFAIEHSRFLSFLKSIR